MTAVAFLAACLSQAGHAQTLPSFDLIGGNIQKRANGVLALMGYSVVPDLTSSFLSIKSAETANPDLNMTQVAGGFTLGQDVPLYLEGGIAFSRYDPKFVASRGVESREVPLRWTSVSGTAGVGWDFPIASELKLRPIANFALGHVESDSSFLGRLIDAKTGRELDFLDGGRLNAYGYGGSLMLDYERYREAYEIDVELRYTYIRLESFGSTSESVKGHADVSAAGIWARWRAPTGLTALQRPVRYVLELAHTQYTGDQRGILGFDYLTSVGAGLELDSSAYDVFITRTRLVFRYAFGDNVTGTAIGLAVSF